MLDKKEVVLVINKFINDYGISPDELFISHGGAMVMHGLRAETSDVDLCISPAGWEKMKRHGFKVIALEPCGSVPGTDMMVVNKDLDLHRMVIPTDPSEVLMYDNVRYASIKRLLADKQALGRDKDQKDIAILSELV